MTTTSDSTITALPAATALSGNEIVPMDQNGTTVRATLSQLWAASGEVIAVNVNTANGLSGTSANVAGTVSLTLGTTITGLLKGNGSAISGATASTDYAPATSGSSILKGNGSGGFATATVGTDYLVPPSGTAVLKANGGGALANAVAGTDYSAGTTALATGILKSTTGTGALTIATGADLPSMSATVGGAVPTPPNNTTSYLRGDGTFATLVVTNPNTYQAYLYFGGI